MCTQPWGVILQQPLGHQPCPFFIVARAGGCGSTGTRPRCRHPREIHRVQGHRKFPSRETHRVRLTFFQQRGYLDRVLWPEHCSGSCVALQDKDNSVISASMTTSTQGAVQLQRGQFFVWKSAATQTTGCDTHFSHTTFVTTGHYFIPLSQLSSIDNGQGQTVC